MNASVARFLLALLLWTLGSGCAAVRIKHPETLDRYVTHVRSSDGWEIALFREPPDPTRRGDPWFGVPVLLVHGTAVNRLNLSYEGSDLAAFLAKEGFDVWLAEYRGDRTSRPPSQAIWRRGDWDVDQIASRDMPAILDHIRQATGHDAVWWVGHSLGGIIGYITAQGPDADKIAGMITLGSPGAFTHPNDMARLAYSFRGLLPKIGQVPSRALAKLLVPMLDLASESRVIHTVLNTKNVSAESLVDFIEPGMENIGRGVVQQYMSWVEGGHITSRDGSIDYSEGLSKITMPMYFLTGRIDHIVPPWTVRYAYDHVGSADKRWRVLGVGWGTRHDYGHGDEAVSDWAEIEVFPELSRWLKERAAGPQPRLGEAAAPPVAAP